MKVKMDTTGPVIVEALQKYQEKEKGMSHIIIELNCTGTYYKPHQGTNRDSLNISHKYLI